MTKNVSRVVLAIVVAVAFILIVVVVRDLWLRRSATLSCGDGPRKAIDMRDFTTNYSAYSVELEADVASTFKISTKVTPIQLQQLSEALESAREFRKSVVAGYNACAITKAQYGRYIQGFQSLDSLAREINIMIGKPSLTHAESAKFSSLIAQYTELARKLGTE